VCGSLTAALLYNASIRITGSVAASLMASLCFAFSPTVWLYAIQAEVFALNNLLCAALVLLMVIYMQREEDEESKETCAKEEDEQQVRTCRHAQVQQARIGVR
jgi:4-amino-4-deoxy-L-arabinose transferase-like glycosyltransferase